MFDRAIRVTFFGANPATLVGEALGPAAFDLANIAGVRAYLKSHWARGPHYDIVIDQFDQVQSHHLDAIRASVRDWLDRNSSLAALPSNFVDQSRRMADAEQWRGPIEPLYSDNDIFLVDDVRTALWGSVALGHAVAIFHHDVLSDIIALTAARRRSRAALILRAARLLASVGKMAESQEFEFWPTSLSAHARIFLTAHPSMRLTFEAAWNRLGQSVAIGDLIARDEEPEDLENWITSGNRITAAIERIQADPCETITPVIVDNPLHIRETLGSDAAVTERLTALFDADRQRAVFSSPRHHRFRIVVNVMYESLAVATVSPVERALACYLVSRAILAEFPDAAARARDAVASLAGQTIA